MKGDFQVRFCENLRVKLPWVIRLYTMPQDRVGIMLDNMIKGLKHSRLLTLILLLTCVSCNFNSKKENKEDKIDKEAVSADYAEIKLMFEKEKIYLLSVSRNMSYDTLYQILNDYIKADYNNLVSGDIGLTDESVVRYEENITKIAKKYKLSKSKVASLIFSFKYEMRTVDEIIGENQASTDESDYQDEQQ